MAKIFEITDDIRQVIQDSIDDLIDQIGKTIKLVYPSKFIQCGNCQFDSVGKKSSNRWKHGGPIPFNIGLCPLCGGSGGRAEEVTESITALCYWDYKNFQSRAAINDSPLQPRAPYSVVETKTYIYNLPKILRAEYMILEPEVEPYIHYKFRLIAEPIDQNSIITGRYIVCAWERISG